MARVFVGIPTYNRPDLVREAIESVKAQSFADWTMVVSDNCSTPDAMASVRRYIEQLADPRINYHAQEVNQGEYGQGWLFLDRSAGCEFMVILHDDDMLTPTYLELAVTALDAAPECDVFAANFVTVDTAGQRLEADTQQRRKLLGRVGAAAGRYDIQSSHVMCGFTPISGTVLRRRALVASGFVDAGRVGNYPFECDLFLRLGDIGAQGWFDPTEGVLIREHPRSLKQTLSLMDNPLIVQPMLELFERRRYDGSLERRRRVLVARLNRAHALIRLRQGDVKGARRQFWAALRGNPLSPQAWVLGAASLVCPKAVVARMPPIQTIRDFGERPTAPRKDPAE